MEFNSGTLSAGACPRIDALIGGEWVEVGRAIRFREGPENDGFWNIALDTPAKLVKGLAAESRIAVTVEGKFPKAAVEALDGVTAVEADGPRAEVRGKGERLVGDVVNALVAAGVRLRDLRTELPTLEDVFLALTGRKVRE